MFGYNPYQFGIDSNTLPVLQNLVSWHDAADFQTITQSGGTVSQWDDKSGNGHNATQGTVSNQPTFSAGGMNGLDTLDFDASNSNFMTLGSVIISGNSARTIFVVFNTDIAGSGVLTLTTGGGAGGVYELNPLPAVAVASGNIVWTESMLSANRVWTLSSLTGANILATLGWRDGIAMTFSAGLSRLINTNTAGTTRFGENFNGSGYWDGKLSEVITYNRSLSISERESVENYLGVKWRITITHP